MQRAMTVSYQLDVVKNSWSTALKVLFRWRGSIWKLVWKELILWLFLYYAVLFIYRSELILTVDQQRVFERISLHINRRVDWIPLTFLLGFFVSVVVDRWRKTFENMGWIENAAVTLSCVVRGNVAGDVQARRAIVRYLCLSQVMVFRDISVKVRRRFPTLETLVAAGFLEEKELEMINAVALDFNKYWIPINWASALAFRLRDQNKVKSEPALIAILNEIKLFRTNLMLLCNFDWVPVPLAYPQVVFFAVRVYFILCLVGRQYIIGEEATNKAVIDLMFPFMTVLQFIFYFGWMKVAESLLNPMGDNDDHFECNVLIDKNIATGMAIVDDTYDDIPPLVWDKFKTHPDPVYSEQSVPKESAATKLVGSATQLKMDPEHIVQMVSVKSEPVLDEFVEDPGHSSGSALTSLRRRISSIRKMSMGGRNSFSLSTDNRHYSIKTKPVECEHKKSEESQFARTMNGRVSSDAGFGESFDSINYDFSRSMPAFSRPHGHREHRVSHTLGDIEEETPPLSRDPSMLRREGDKSLSSSDRAESRGDKRLDEVFEEDEELSAELARSTIPDRPVSFQIHSPSPPGSPIPTVFPLFSSETITVDETLPQDEKPTKID